MEKTMEDFIFANNLRRIMNQQNLTGEKLGELIGVGKSTIINWANGTRFPQKEEHIKSLVNALNISYDDLFWGEELTPVKQVPIVGGTSCVTADINYLQENNRKANYNGEFWSQELYCVIANGDSMSPEIEDGDEIIIDPRVKPVHGDMVHYKIDGESAVKLLTKDDEAHIMQFIPYNQSEDFKIKTVRLDDEDTLSRLSYHKVVSVNKLKYNNRLARLRLIGRA